MSSSKRKLPIEKLLQVLDITTMFRPKRAGNLRRWSAKRTIGGSIVGYALYAMDGDITPLGVLLCAVGIVPLCLSFFEKSDVS